MSKTSSDNFIFSYETLLAQLSSFNESELDTYIAILKYQLFTALHIRQSRKVTSYLSLHKQNPYELNNPKGFWENYIGNRNEQVNFHPIEPPSSYSWSAIVPSEENLNQWATFEHDFNSYYLEYKKAIEAFSGFGNCVRFNLIESNNLPQILPVDISTGFVVAGVIFVSQIISKKEDSPKSELIDLKPKPVISPSKSLVEEFKTAQPNFEKTVVFNKIKGWTVDELEQIIADPEQFLDIMFELKSSNVVLVEELCEKIGTDKVFERIAEYLGSSKIPQELDDEKDKILISNLVTIVGIFFSHFWDNNIDKYRKDEVLFEKRLSKLLTLVKSVHPRVIMMFLGKLSNIGREEVIEFMEEVEEIFSSRTMKFLTKRYIEVTERAKRFDILCSLDYFKKTNTMIICP